MNLIIKDMSVNYKKWSAVISAIFLVVLCKAVALGQNMTLPMVLPPAPHSAALINYNAPQIGLSTGTLQLAIPLFELKDRDLTVPISLKYATNGVKVDEIASRVGLGWVLNSGGVITRVVNNRPDERSTRRYPPNDGYVQDANLLSYLQDVTLTTTYDTEPDEFYFNFNGYSGKFILDSAMHPLVMPYNGLKVDFSGGLNPSITITTPDGTAYFFNDTELSTNLSFCYGDASSLTGSPIPTAWYLSKITTKDGRKCEFFYDNVSYEYYGPINESVVRSDDLYNQLHAVDACLVQTINYCSNWISLQAKQLSSIKAPNAVVNFYYQSRQDIPGDKLVSYVELKSNGKLVDKYSFDYTTSTADNSYENAQIKIDTGMVHRPFLTAVHHLGDGTTVDQVHRLTYNDINGLPQRASFSQDYFGFYNGKHNANFIQAPSDSTFAHIFGNLATADRMPDSAYITKGILTKIEYPTGGSDNFSYSANDYFSVDTIPPTTATLNNNLNSTTSYPLTQNSSSFQIQYNYPAYNRIVANMLMATDPDGNYSVNPEDDLITVKVLRSSDDAEMFSQTLKAGQEVDESFNYLALNTNYYLSTQVLQPYIRAKFRITYPTSNPTLANVNHTAAGARIAKIVTNDGMGHNMIKKFYYASLDSLGTSSGVKFQDPTFASTIDELIYHGINWDFCRQITMTSSPSLPVYQYAQSTTQYRTVVESWGESFDNGAISHSFISQREGLNATLAGINHVYGFKYSNTGYLNNYEYQTDYYKNSGPGLTKLKQVLNYYRFRTDIGRTMPAYIAIRHWDSPVHPSQFDFQGYELYRYTQNARWVVLDSTKTIDYESPATMTTLVKNFYTDSNSLAPTQTITKNSKGEEIIKNTSYPTAMVSNGRDPYGAYQSMIDNHVMNIPIEDSVTVNGSQVSFNRSNYTVPNFFQPSSTQFRIGAKPLETAIVFNSYSGSNITSVKKADGPLIAYRWGYHGQYPIAECKNAAPDEFYLQTFEELTTGIDSTTAGHTGRKHFNGSFTTTDKLAVGYHGRSYVISYWHKTGGAWQYSGELPYSGQTLSGDLDDIRIYPADSQLSSYTYDPLFGITSSIDTNGLTTYYEYDGFQRLLNIRDKDGNIVKHMDYHYKQ